MRFVLYEIKIQKKGLNKFIYRASEETELLGRICNPRQQYDRVNEEYDHFAQADL